MDTELDKNSPIFTFFDIPYRKLVLLKIGKGGAGTIGNKIPFVGVNEEVWKDFYNNVFVAVSVKT